jgi:hypothetical protein
VSDPEIFLPLAVLASAHRHNQSSKPCGEVKLNYTAGFEHCKVLCEGKYQAATEGLSPQAASLLSQK